MAYVYICINASNGYFTVSIHVELTIDTRSGQQMNRRQMPMWPSMDIGLAGEIEPPKCNASFAGHW